MILVVDASVALKWFLHIRGDEDHADQAMRILEGAAAGRHRLVQPPHFLAEVTAVLAREKPRDAKADLADLMDLEFSFADTPPMYAKAADLALRRGCHVFDTLYHAAALLTQDALLVTADRRYFDKARAEGRITMLADLSP